MNSPAPGASEDSPDRNTRTLDEEITVTEAVTMWTSRFVQRVGLASLCVIFLFAGRARPVRPPEFPERVPPVDSHTLSNYLDVRVTHIAFDLIVDFEARVIRGSATLDLDHRNEATELVLDTRSLTIEEVTLETGQPTPWSMGGTSAILGSPLLIEITPQTTRVTISYSTSPSAPGLHWMTPEQAKQSTPYLYSQNETIDARSWIPCQDTPQVRVTYDATVRVPPGLMALMSAENPITKSVDGVYQFRMTTPIPSYLITLGVADVEFRAIDERTGVYARPDLVEDAMWELAELPLMLDAIESIAGPYLWDRYDILVMPPSYHIGGMEHPRLTFANPYFVSGDRSLLQLIAHELAHSWAGDQITTATWNDVWLNEGLTVYLARRAIEDVNGRDYSEMLSWNGSHNLIAAVASMGHQNDATRLHYDVSSLHPNNSFSTIPYEKGHIFMRMLEEELGRNLVDAFLRTYFRQHRFTWMDAEHFLSFLEKFLASRRPDAIETLGITNWIYGTGLPSNTPVITSLRFDQVQEQIEQFESGRPASLLDHGGWGPHEVIHFLSATNPSLLGQRLGEVDRAFDLDDSINEQVLLWWSTHVAWNRWTPGYPGMERYLQLTGGRGGLYSIYDALNSSGNRTLAEEIYSRARPTYHPFMQQAVDELLGWTAKTGEEMPRLPAWRY